MRPTRDAPPERDFFTMIPNVVGQMGLDPYAFRLYAHLRQVAGEQGACWQSTSTLAAACAMSRGKVTEAKRVLVDRGLIRVEKRRGRGGLHDHVTIVDIWARNHRHFAPAPAERHPEGRDPPPAGDPPAAPGSDLCPAADRDLRPAADRDLRPVADRDLCPVADRDAQPDADAPGAQAVGAPAERDRPARPAAVAPASSQDVAASGGRRADEPDACDRPAPPAAVAPASSQDVNARRVHEVASPPARGHVADAGTGSSHPAAALRSPGGRKKIPPIQTPPPEPKNPPQRSDPIEDQGRTCSDADPRRSALPAPVPGERADTGERATAPTAFVRALFDLFRVALGRRPGAAEREEIAALAARCTDLGVWQRAFDVSARATHRWPYAAACVRNAVAERASADRAGWAVAGAAQGACPRGAEAGSPADAAPGSAAGPGPRCPVGAGPGSAMGAAAAPAPDPDDPDMTRLSPSMAWFRPPPPAYVTRWEQVLGDLKLKMDPSTYLTWFANTVCVGERDEGRTWRVAVNTPLALGVFERYAPLLRRVLDRLEAGDVTVEWEVRG